MSTVRTQLKLLLPTLPAASASAHAVSRLIDKQANTQNQVGAAVGDLIQAARGGDLDATRVLTALATPPQKHFLGRFRKTDSLVKTLQACGAYRDIARETACQATPELQPWWTALRATVRCAPSLARVTALRQSYAAATQIPYLGMERTLLLAAYNRHIAASLAELRRAKLAFLGERLNAAEHESRGPARFRELQTIADMALADASTGLACTDIAAVCSKHIAELRLHLQQIRSLNTRLNTACDELPRAVFIAELECMYERVNRLDTRERQCAKLRRRVVKLHNAALDVEYRSVLSLVINGRKCKWHNASGELVRALNCEDGRFYLITGKFARGSFGKMKLGVRNDGYFVAIKEARLCAKAGFDKDGTERTEAVSEDDVMREMWSGVASGSAARPLQLVRDPVAAKLYLVMPLFEQGDLRSAAKAMRRAGVSNADLCLVARRALSDLCRIGTVMHRRKLLHGDITPGNVFCQNGRIALGDFGVARPVRRARGIVTTLHYAAPEMLQNPAAYDEKVDVWSALLTCITVVAPSPFSLGDDTLAVKHLHTDFAGWRPNTYAQPQYSAFSYFFGFLEQHDPAFARIVTTTLCLSPAARPSMCEVVTLLERPEFRLSEAEHARIDQAWQNVGSPFVEQMQTLNRQLIYLQRSQ